MISFFRHYGSKAVITIIYTSLRDCILSIYDIIKLKSNNKISGQNLYVLLKY